MKKFGSYADDENTHKQFFIISKIDIYDTDNRCGCLCVGEQRKKKITANPKKKMTFTFIIRYFLENSLK